jgi:hypothetical protein
MNATEQSIDLLAAQECESLAACVSRGQAPESYADIVAKLRGHADKLSDGRRAFWTEQAKALGIDLYPKPAKGKSSKPEASSTP